MRPFPALGEIVTARSFRRWQQDQVSEAVKRLLSETPGLSAAVNKLAEEAAKHPTEPKPETPQ